MPPPTKLATLLGLYTVVSSFAAARRSHGNRATRPNFGPALPHRAYHHGVEPETGSVEYLTTAALLRDPVDLALSTHKSTHNGVTHVYIQQVVNGLQVTNGVANVNIDRAGRVISFGHSLHTAEPALFRRDGFRTQQDDDPSALSAPPATPRLAPSDAVESLAQYLNLEFRAGTLSTTAVASGFLPTYSDEPLFFVTGLAAAPATGIPARLKYVQVSGGELRLVWDLELDLGGNFYSAVVDAVNGDVLGLVDWVADAAYNFWPLPSTDPDSGPRELVFDPAHPVASPLGWNSQGTDDQNMKVFTSTIGSNVHAQDNVDGRSDWRDNYRPEVNKSLVFDFPVDFNEHPVTYVDAAITNLFYWNNMIHDLFCQAGKFQQVNLGKGGKGNDAVIANAQDGAGFNDANFMSPPDGRQPRMRVYIFDWLSPMRDGDRLRHLMHEYSHGISVRLTGGPENVNCLGWGEAGGMGEGWGDIFATITRLTPTTPRNQSFGMFEYVTGGIVARKYRYSTSKEVNPSTYGYITKPDYWHVHPKGEVWAITLFEDSWNLVDKHGFSPDWFTPPNTAVHGTAYRHFRTGRTTALNKDEERKPAGNVILLQLVVDGMKFQPCYPSFVDARDAILQADEVNNAGENACEIWAGFAKRGLGAGARSGGREDFTLPKKCGGSKVV
ncbi:Fungalysin metallopeptidase-domain-containing protein [Blyttiomyces helicus]|uniref:Extracellular metalloproteinase n=1 Tax=Blyttiomyces helicus TaxID=388810 RepID=A0A4P9W4Z5_9FUNG|nr:Fungalysin metallopeptidase-domain-containing protein [Blyttiomyces helicus]|eukprot:RKO87304.1 Fungalysin metallopeptidase-domain-containing protein [Blyttiomyces helicus]